ncbi:MAG: porin [Rickettsiales bacterium]|nr:porin [Rickettsiales bacterium]
MIKKNISKVIFALLFTSNAALAQSIPNELFQSPNTPVVTVGGFINFAAEHASQSKAYSKDRLPDTPVDADGQNTHATLTDATEFYGTPNRYSSKTNFANDSEIYIKVGAISDSGLKYGAIVELEADTTPNGRGNGFNADKSFIFTESQAGKFEFGNNLAANQKMKVGPSVFARAAGGINGKYLEYINTPMLAHSTQVENAGGVAVCQGGVGTAVANCANVKMPRFILIPQSPVGHGGYAKGFYNGTSITNSDGNYNNNANPAVHGSFNNNSLITGNNVVNNGLGIKNGSFGQMEDATKISYYTPRINGWQLGGSFTPDTGNTGTSAVINGNNAGNIKNVVSWALNYSNNIGNLGFATSVTGENGQFQNSKAATTVDGAIIRDRLNSYDAGIMVTYFGFTIGGSYGYWGTSLQQNKGIYSCDYNSEQTLAAQNCSDPITKGKKFAGAKYYTTGLAYEFGPIAFSITTISSNFQKNKYQAQSFGIDYKMARGLMPYIEVTKFKFTSNQPHASDIASTATKQIFDNKGYVGLVGVLFAF